MKVVVVGAGRMGQYHLSALNKIREKETIEDIGIFDIIEEKAKEASLAYGVSPLKSLDDIYLFKPDLIIIATPSSTHYELANRLLDIADLLVEKPVITSMDDGISLLNRSKKSGHMVIPAHIERFNPLVELFASIKDIYHIDAKRLSNLNRDYSIYINVVFDLVLHDIDAIIWNTKPNIISLNALNVERNGVLVSSMASLIIDDRMTATIHASWISPIKLRQYTVMRNQGNMCTLDLLNKRTDCGSINNLEVDQLVLEDSNAINVVKGIENPRATLEDAIRAQRIIDAVMRGGGVVSI